MTDPTPTRAEDARIPDHCAWEMRGHWSRAYEALLEDHKALRERAEAADSLITELRHRYAVGQVAITEARRAEAAAWNDAIEAAAEWHQSEIARLKEQVSENNAYLARVGAASYDSDANRYCIDQISAHEQSVAAIRALRRAAPTEGEA